MLGGLRRHPGDKSAIYPQAGSRATCVLMTGGGDHPGRPLRCLLQRDLWTPAALTLVLALGTIGLAAVGTLFAAVTAQVRARELLFPVLLLPIQVPVLLATVSATQVALAGQPLADAGAWLQLLAGADIVYLVIGLLTFEFVLEG
jgi:heme exporter protein B